MRLKHLILTPAATLGKSSGDSQHGLFKLVIKRSSSELIPKIDCVITS